jgi:rhodanese-related sulfurtransferase
MDEPEGQAASEPAAIDALLEVARARLNRLTPAEAVQAQATGALLVDIRPVEQRERDGLVPGAVVIDRNVLEWRLDPASAHRIPEADSYGRPVVLLCNEGYATSLAAATLQELGLSQATDVIGGFQQWRTDGQPIVPPC